LATLSLPLALCANVARAPIFATPPRGYAGHDMPLEGHWQRAHTPLRRLTRRERNAAIAAVVATLAAVFALVLATIGDSRPDPAPGCIYAIVPGVMGATPVDACGARARSLCSTHATLTDPGSRAIQASCRRAGLLSP
jgi:hypothetical protein